MKANQSDQKVAYICLVEIAEKKISLLLLKLFVFYWSIIALQCFRYMAKKWTEDNQRFNARP